jgi:ArsR family transcriptional regulator, arsenate/arsenite/antimonite-responsive transcriptional repressor / arsenate reductase (thioredoxin)
VSHRPERAFATPHFLQLAGHPLRWRLLRELALSDRRVGELTGLLDRPQSLISYHLGRLRGADLVSMRRSSADGRDAYYRLDLGRCGEALARTGAALHPGLRLVPPAAVEHAGPARTVRVLFLCTGNSSRSQIAEALLVHLSHGVVRAFSAGSRPKAIHSQAMRVMDARGLDLRGSRSKHLDEFAGQRFDYVITLCDRVREVCPEFSDSPPAIHWSVADPASESDAAFDRTADVLEVRIRFLLHTIEQESQDR